MGHAKQRGTQDQRIAAALEKVETLRPAQIVCNNCNAALTEIITLNSTGMNGIEAAFAAHCASCEHDTFAVRGDPDAVADFALLLEAANDTEVKLGMAPIPVLK